MRSLRIAILVYLLGGFEVLEDAVDGAPIHEEMILDALHHHPKTTSFETRGGWGPLIITHH